MNRIGALIIATFIFQASCTQHKEEDINKQSKLEPIFTEIRRVKQDSNTIKNLNKLINDPQIDNESKLTAKLLLADQFLRVNSGVDSIQTRQLLSEIIESKEVTWQKDVARMLLISTYEARDGIDAKINVIKEALEKIDFNRLEKTQDLDFLNYYAIHGLKPENIREKLLLALGDAYCQKKDVQNAELILNSIKDKELRSMLEQDISQIKK